MLSPFECVRFCLAFLVLFLGFCLAAYIWRPRSRMRQNLLIIQECYFLVVFILYFYLQAYWWRAPAICLAVIIYATLERRYANV